MALYLIPIVQLWHLMVRYFLIFLIATLYISPLIHITEISATFMSHVSRSRLTISYFIQMQLAPSVNNCSENDFEDHCN